MFNIRIKECNLHDSCNAVIYRVQLQSYLYHFQITVYSVHSNNILSHYTIPPITFRSAYYGLCVLRATHEVYVLRVTYALRETFLCTTGNIFVFPIGTYYYFVYLHWSIGQRRKKLNMNDEIPNNFVSSQVFGM